MQIYAEKAYQLCHYITSAVSKVLSIRWINPDHLFRINFGWTQVDLTSGLELVETMLFKEEKTLFVLEYSMF